MAFQRGPTPGGGGGGGNVPRSRNGRATGLGVYTVPRVNDPSLARAPGNTNDDLIVKIKNPWVHKEHAIDPPNTPANHSWTDDGPRRGELHLRTFTYRKEAGDSHQDTEGMHTVLPRVSTNKGSQKPRVMASGRQDRLTTVIFRGQTYSEGTLPQGAKNRGQ